MFVLQNRITLALLYNYSFLSGVKIRHIQYNLLLIHILLLVVIICNMYLFYYLDMPYK